MATTTTNYGLKKPDYNDNADIGIINDNMDIIDAKMKEIEEAGGGSTITIDTELSTTSENPVQNKVITEALNGKAPSNHGHDDLSTLITKAFKHLPTYATTSEYGKWITDALLVSLDSADDETNNIGYVYDGGTSNLPNDCNNGIREVYYYNSNDVFVKITGRRKNAEYITEWFNRYNGSAWIGWSEAVLKSDLDELTKFDEINYFSGSIGVVLYMLGTINVRYLGKNIYGKKMFNVNVDASAYNDTQSDSDNPSFVHLGTIIEAIKQLDPTVNTVEDINGGEFKIRYISKLDGTPLDASFNGYGMSLKLFDDATYGTHLSLGRYYDTNGNWGAWKNCDIPPLRFGFSGIVICS